MRLLCTGNRGFVGEATQKYCEEMGVNVVGYDIMDGLDIRDGVQFEKVVADTQPDRILHLAAIARFAEADEHPRLAFETNTMGTRNVAATAWKYKIPLIYASTGSVYMPIKQDPPITEKFSCKGNSVYACSKYLGEEYIRYYGMPYIILRYAHLYGKEKRLHGLIGGFIERFERGLNPVLYGGGQSNDFMYIDDVVQANYLAITAPWDRYNQEYNIGTGEELTTEQAAKLICQAAKYKGKIDRVAKRSVDADRFFYDTSKAEKILRFKAKNTLKQGLTKMFK